MTDESAIAALGRRVIEEGDEEALISSLLASPPSLSPPSSHDDEQTAWRAKWLEFNAPRLDAVSARDHDCRRSHCALCVLREPDVWICPIGGHVHWCDARRCDACVTNADGQYVCTLTARCYTSVQRAPVPQLMSIEARAQLRREYARAHTRTDEQRLRAVLTPLLRERAYTRRAHIGSVKRVMARAEQLAHTAEQSTLRQRYATSADRRAALARLAIKQAPVLARIDRCDDVVFERCVAIAQALWRMLLDTIARDDASLHECLRHINFEQHVVPLLVMILAHGVRTDAHVIVPQQMGFAVVYEAMQWRQKAAPPPRRFSRKYGSPTTLYQRLCAALLRRAEYDFCFSVHDYAC